MTTFLPTSADTFCGRIRSDSVVSDAVQNQHEHVSDDADQKCRRVKDVLDLAFEKIKINSFEARLTPTGKVTN